MQKVKRLIFLTRNPAFELRVIPKAILSKHERIWPNPPYNYEPYIPWTDRNEAVLDPTLTPVERTDVVKISILHVLGIKNLHKHAVIRKKIAYKLKTAMDLIIRYDANVEREDSDTKLPPRLVKREELPSSAPILESWLHFTAGAFPDRLISQTGLILSSRSCLSISCPGRNWWDICGMRWRMLIFTA